MKVELIKDNENLGEVLNSKLKNTDFDRLKIMVAFVKYSGIAHLYESFSKFINIGGQIEMIAGIDLNGTSIQALEQLQKLSRDNLYIHHDVGFNTFHPKVYIFEKKENIISLIIGSSNLTVGGLFNNYEANIILTPENKEIDDFFLQDINNYFKNLLNNSNTIKASTELILLLYKNGLLADETKSLKFTEIINRVNSKNPLPFSYHKKPRIPKVTIPEVAIVSKSTLYLSLSNFDVSSRSLDPVMLIPISALNENPLFWKWPLSFSLSDGGYPERYTTANIFLPNEKIENYAIRIYYYERKDEFRLQCAPIKRNGHPGDIMVIEKSNSGKAEYNITLIRFNTDEYNKNISYLAHRVSTLKKFGYK